MATTVRLCGSWWPPATFRHVSTLDWRQPAVSTEQPSRSGTNSSPSQAHNSRLSICTEAQRSAVCWGTVLQARRSRVRFPMVSLEVFIDINLPASLWPSGRLSLKHKWVPGIFHWGKGGRCAGLTIWPPSRADCLEIWKPQPTWTLRAGKGTDCFTSLLFLTPAQSDCQQSR